MFVRVFTVATRPDSEAGAGADAGAQPHDSTTDTVCPFCALTQCIHACTRIAVQDAAELLRSELADAARAACGRLAAARGGGGGNSSGGQGEGEGSSTDALHELQLLLQLVGSPYFRPAVVDGSLIEALAALLLAGPLPGSLPGDAAAERSVLLHVLEAVGQVRGRMPCTTGTLYPRVWGLGP